MSADLTGHTVYVIAGPTAVGKTSVAIALAQRLRTAIISADSRQCYKEMSIGTAKPSAEELAAVKHYFINEFSVAESLTAADFEERSLEYLHQIFNDSNTAVVCGGTGLYVKALCDPPRPVQSAFARLGRRHVKPHRRMVAVESCSESLQRDLARRAGPFRR